MKCVHCKMNRVYYSRGLCWKCYYNPEIRAITPLLRKQYSVPTIYLATKPDSATDCQPGSEAKIRVMEHRVELGQSPFHPADWIPE